jgi:hypothetical protein
MSASLFGHWPRWKWLYRLGRRGAVLSVLGLIDILFGVAALLAPPQNSSALIFPVVVWTCGWFAVAVTCFWSAWRDTDWPGYAASILIKWTYGVAYLAAFWADDLYRAWVTGIFWFLFGFLVLLVAGWTEDRTLEPPPLLVVVPTTAEEVELSESDEGNLANTLTQLRQLRRTDEDEGEGGDGKNASAR